MTPKKVTKNAIELAADMAYNLHRMRNTLNPLWAIEYRGRAYKNALKLCALGANESDVKELIYKITQGR